MVCLSYMRNVSFLLVTVISVLFFVRVAEAKVLPQAGRAPITGIAIKSTGTTIGVYPRFRADRKALVVSFTNLQNAKSVSYSLVYSQGPLGQQEGAGGALNLIGQTTNKVELLFGTCSAGVCKYHTGIKDARLEVSYTSVNGKKYLKKFKLKV